MVEIVVEAAQVPVGEAARVVVDRVVVGDAVTG